MFTSLGERIGGLSHVSSFWRYCVPRPNSTPMAATDLYEILLDFEASLGLEESGPPASNILPLAAVG